MRRNMLAEGPECQFFRAISAAVEGVAARTVSGRRLS